MLIAQHTQFATRLLSVKKHVFFVFVFFITGYDCVCSKNGIPEFIVKSQRKDLAVLVTVSNMDGDDAYEAKLVGTFPNTMSYSGVRTDQTTVSRL